VTFQTPYHLQSHLQGQLPVTRRGTRINGNLVIIYKSYKDLTSKNQLGEKNNVGFAGVE
jgi:hypothetical protein